MSNLTGGCSGWIWEAHLEVYGYVNKWKCIVILDVSDRFLKLLVEGVLQQVNLVKTDRQETDVQDLELSHTRLESKPFSGK